MHAYASRGRGRPPGVRPDRTLNYNTITLLSVGVHICAGWLNIEKSFLSRFVVSFYIAKGPCRSCGKFYWSTLWFMKITGGKRKKKKRNYLLLQLIIAVKIIIFNGYRSRISRENGQYEHYDESWNTCDWKWKILSNNVIRFLSLQINNNGKLLIIYEWMYKLLIE